MNFDTGNSISSLDNLQDSFPNNVQKKDNLDAVIIDLDANDQNAVIIPNTEEFEREDTRFEINMVKSVK